MRRLKIISLLTSILSCLIIFSIGFSSWYEFNPPVKTFSGGGYTAFDIAAIENEEMSVFQFSALSFKDVRYEDGKLSGFSDTDTGIISVKYRMPAASVAATGGNFILDISLGYENALTETLFKDAFGVDSNNCTVKFDGVVVDNVTVGDSNDEITFKKEFLEKPSEDFEFTVTYEFYIPRSVDGENNFRNTFGQYIHGADGGKEPTRFVATALITQK